MSTVKGPLIRLILTVAHIMYPLTIAITLQVLAKLRRGTSAIASGKLTLRQDPQVPF